jgi:hypothetical protein
MLVPDVELKIERFEQKGKIQHRWFHLKDGTHKKYLSGKVYGKISEHDLKRFPIEDKTKNNKFLLSEGSERKYENRISEIDKWTPQRKRKYEKIVSGDKIPYFVYIFAIYIYIENVLSNTSYKIGMSKDPLVRLTNLIEDWQTKVKSEKIKIYMKCLAREEFDSHKSAKRREDSLLNMTEKYSLDKSDITNLDKSFINNPSGYTEIRKELSPVLENFIQENKVKY